MKAKRSRNYYLTAPVVLASMLYLYSGHLVQANEIAVTTEKSLIANRSKRSITMKEGEEGQIDSEWKAPILEDIEGLESTNEKLETISEEVGKNIQPEIKDNNYKVESLDEDVNLQATTKDSYLYDALFNETISVEEEEEPKRLYEDIPLHTRKGILKGTWRPGSEDNLSLYNKENDPNLMKNEDGDLVMKDQRRRESPAFPSAVTVYVKDENYSGKDGRISTGVNSSGSVIGKNLVLTCAHCVQQDDNPATMGYVIPGRDDDKEPFGRFKIKAMHIPEEYVNGPYNLAFDLAILEIEPNEKGQSIGDLVAPLKLREFSDDLIGKDVVTFGYPDDKYPEEEENVWYPIVKTQWRSEGKIMS
ncbi:trypsin-like peptidase domain-containing protein [Streptococcus didelphis]|uniref:Serine protease n=1 Tax=Streptococcus didelphis TaxID=102886 RepID=A0ABY9LHY3_9STRE|nr:trypsin-like peptidase domain-containing protein [Streptococcus didelphis]WMB28429.1 trypsin-like peptidase domain-containing protein [Streptococcus didelphis]WMB29106.1 trypsin-like peptidase domain-containing protein [Streptococcus didelphis]